MSYLISCKSFCNLILTFPFFPTYCTPKFLYCLSFLFFSFFFFSLFFPPPCFSSSLICFPFLVTYSCFTTVCLVWKLSSMHLALTCARLLVKPRQPCSIGRCLRTCVVPHRTAKTLLRPLQSVLWRPPLRAWPLRSLCSQALEGRQVIWSASWWRSLITVFKESERQRRARQGLSKGTTGRAGKHN